MLDYIKRLEHKHFKWLEKQHTGICWLILTLESWLVVGGFGYGVYKLVEFVYNIL